MKPDSNAIFILGILPRSGTNFLSNLLLLHPDCAPPDPVWEDFLVTHLDQLAAYSDAVAGRWDKAWGVSDGTQAELDTALGSGLTRFLEDRCPRPRVISKTPRVENLDLFFRFFPGAKLLILVRDGRSIIESGVRSFGWRREPALHLLSDAAQTINRFTQSAGAHGDKFRVVRYEDLWQHTEAQLRELFAFLQLDMDSYDLRAALNLPVRGSSELNATEGESVHWDPVERTAAFDPMSRFAGWGNARHYRYNRVAGDDMESFGYPRMAVTDQAGLLHVQNLFLDFTWRIRRLLRPLYYRISRR